MLAILLFYVAQFVLATTKTNIFQTEVLSYPSARTSLARLTAIIWNNRIYFLALIASSICRIVAELGSVLAL